MTTTTALATQVYQVFIRATPEAIWEAITVPEFTETYFHGSRIEITSAGRRSLGPDGEVRGDSPVLEFDRPGGSFTAGSRSTTPSHVPLRPLRSAPLFARFLRVGRAGSRLDPRPL